MNTPNLFLNEYVINLFRKLHDDEVIRIELINGNKIYYLPSDDIYMNDEIIHITKPINDKKQQIIIDVNSIAVVCTMSRKTYDLKLQRGELYV